MYHQNSEYLNKLTEVGRLAISGHESCSGARNGSYWQVCLDYFLV